MKRRYYTPAEADRSLPLVRAIARDVRETAVEMKKLWSAAKSQKVADPARVHLEERVRVAQERFGGLLEELQQLGVELKDPFQGLLDFRAERKGREVYLCWRLGEDRIAHWHELGAGFAGRKPIDTF
jgi:hypothetical protein